MKLGLPQATLRVSQMTGQPVIPRKTYDAAVSGRFPAEFASGRWWVNETDLPKIAEALGMKVLDDVSPAHKAVAASTAVAA